MRWIASLLVVLAMLAGAARSAPPSVDMTAQASSGPVLGVAACEGCPAIVVDCLASPCEVPGVFEGGADGWRAVAARIGGGMADDTPQSEIARPPIPPPPRG